MPWQFLQVVFDQTGVLGIVCLIIALVMVFLVKMYQKKDKCVEELNKALLDMSEKRLTDIIEDREKYEELSEELKTSIDILIKVYRRRNGNHNDE